jgi:aminoglycoside phosphotransferase (APT) family kinase protein
VLSVPDGAAGLTAAWVSDALHHEATAVRVTPVGTGQTGATYRLVVDFADGTAVSYVAKTGAEDPEVRQRVAGGYRSEIAFYRDIASTVSIPVPQVHAIAATEDCSQFALLMEDLAPAEQGDQIAGTGPDVVLVGARALAGLHGPRWCDPEWQKLDVLVMPVVDETSVQGLVELTQMATGMVRDAIGARLSAAALDMIGALSEAVPRMLLASPERFALLHGDFRLDNVMLRPDGSLSVVDWQTLMVGLPARDLAYWVTTSLEPDVRRAVEDQVLDAYLGALAVPGYTRAELVEDYRVSQLQVPFMTCLALAFVSQTERGADMFAVMLERAAAACRDLEVL